MAEEKRQVGRENARPRESGPRFTISLKRSTPNLQLSTRTPANYPIYWGKAEFQIRARNDAIDPGSSAAIKSFNCGRKNTP